MKIKPIDGVFSILKDKKNRYQEGFNRRKEPQQPVQVSEFGKKLHKAIADANDE